MRFWPRGADGAMRRASATSGRSRLPRSTSTDGTSSPRSSRTHRSVARVRRAGREAPTVAAGADRIGAVKKRGRGPASERRHTRATTARRASAATATRPHLARGSAPAPPNPFPHHLRSPPRSDPFLYLLLVSIPVLLRPTRRRPLCFPPVLPALIYLAGRGRGVQREAVDPPSSRRTGGIGDLGRRRGGARVLLGTDLHEGTRRRERLGRQRW
jgi:hypothetical protein